MEPQVELTGYGKNVTVLSSKIRFTEDYEKQVKIFLYDDGGMMFESDSGMSVYFEPQQITHIKQAIHRLETQVRVVPPPSQADEDLPAVAYPQHRRQAIIWDDMENLFRLSFQEKEPSSELKL